jgi:hypothetical protein
VLGDYEIVMKILRGINHQNNFTLQGIYRKIKQEERKFINVEYFHILRQHNQKQIGWLRNPRLMNQGELKNNEVTLMSYIP